MLAPKPEGSAKSGNNRRRKSSQDLQRIKHRRTRSGCYTCRARRVKCDEQHPICERCRKGSRECVYPEPKEPASRSSAAGKSSQAESHGSPDSSPDESEDDPESERPGTVQENDNPTGEDCRRGSISTIPAQRPESTQNFAERRSLTRLSSETPSLIQDKGASPTPSTEGSLSHSHYTGVVSRPRKQPSSASTASNSRKTDWTHLPRNLQYYLDYFYENLTHHHYSLKYDPCNFLQTSYIDIALKNEVLLYAVVGFSAFQATLHSPSGKIQDFLQYYNKAVSLLLRSLKKGDRHEVGTLLAILQLATVEEYLGDWVNLLGHQKAALEILTELYTPQSVMQSDVSRVILGWYTRFDVFASLMGGFETTLSREWFSYPEEFYQKQSIGEPGNLVWRIEKIVAQLRLLGMDMSILFAKIGKQEISREQFMEENKRIGERIVDWKEKMDPALQDPRYLITDFSGARALDPDDIVNPYIPGIIYAGPLWTVNLSTLDWYSIDLMHQYQTALTMQTQPGAELSRKAYKCCQLFEAIQFHPQCPNGTLLAAQASLGISCLFLSRDPTHAMWARRKLAAIEAEGYIYPYTFRTKMSDLFQDRSCMHWWLPNEEGYPSIIKSIRKFVEERTAPAKDVSTEGLRDMKAIFSSMNLDDGKSTPPKLRDGKNIMGVDNATSTHGWATSSPNESSLEELDIARTPEDNSYHLETDHGYQGRIYGDLESNQYQ
ncbi:hypothetical protein BP6252_04362 [Coleophoma cylindrospora]|uniref:Zn(2)-C6 fungal-type domain-containing protein n=1 Tax=Coleophoma cylindrospora TaxID=1849047 RepID=A0A3D8S0V8_9HELO|nr:hypothetical protein BP6252_04362 [Coleophoma cylindrospora]